MTSLRSAGWPVEEQERETMSVPVAPHPGTADVGTYSAPAKLEPVRVTLSQSYTSPGLSFLLCPGHPRLLVDMESQG